MAVDSWQRIAHALANRLAYASCDNHVSLKEGCPFCEDVRAFLLFVKKNGSNPFIQSIS